ncbi:DUF2207 domain-containing protein [Cellulomonas edaphi]|uniref:DUF2207 domain-containing protein n=1 Tax=Cellulomonas edaphi TaxID=3053468 RepID=A0ABT7SA30_9CELL|nr:DUF2207 domain-containing protein [Cellulomons edaphi]MDM7832483.1 DUF2207 domain-containing protein [Cellulomons edaphi]
MRSVAVAVAGLVGVLLPSAASAATAGSAASAADGGQQITHYAESVALDADGTAHVELDLTLDFANTPGHGPFLTIPERESTDDGRVRVYGIDDFSASSPTGAPAGLDVRDTGDAVEVRIGDPAKGDVAGLQQYHVEYTVTDLVNTAKTTGDGDQLYWDPIGPDWELPLSDVSVTVSGPAAVERARCFAGELGTTASCSSSDVTADGATFTQDALEPGEALTVVAGWPAGTFPGASAVFEPSEGGSDDTWAEEGLPSGDLELGDDGLPPSFVLGPDGEWVEESSGGVGVEGAAAGVGVVIGLGVVGVVVAIVIAMVRRGSGPGEPPAEVMSLAAQGYLRMDPVAPSGPRGRANWSMVPLRPADDAMSARERAWHQAMFFAGMLPVFWNHVRPPMHHHHSSFSPSHHSSFSSGMGAGGGGGFGGDAGAGGGAGGGGGGSW